MRYENGNVCFGYGRWRGASEDQDYLQLCVNIFGRETLLSSIDINLFIWDIIGFQKSTCAIIYALQYVAI